MSLNGWPKRDYAYRLPLRYHLAGSGSGLVICLHGFQDHAASMLERLGWLGAEALPFRVLGVNAPFPTPIRTARGYQEAYAWYFRDATSGFEVSSPGEAAARIRDLLDDLDLAQVPSVIVGFSQGAYLAPYLARRLTDARAIIGLGGGYPAENYEPLGALPVHAVHGAKDEVIPLAKAQREHAGLTGRAGEFHVIEALAHRVDASIEPLVRHLARAALA